MEEPDVPLTGGGRTAVARRGGVVHRETGPWAPSVHALLRHLEASGFEAAPRVVGTGFDADGREMLTYIEGEIVNPAPWTDAAITAVGRMIRRLHDATATFVPPDGATWRPWFGRDIGDGRRIVGHCDAAPWNIVARNGHPVALIDWEVAGPVDPLTELAQVAWNNAHLYDDDVAAMNGLPDAPVRITQVRLLADGYGLPAPDRQKLTARIIDVAALSAANEVIEQQITPDTEHAPRVWGIAWQARSVAWMIRHRALIERALA
ncbi:aminoglycoside phosphotransferase family protein [Reyranella sp. CPCC 100927]|uniref:phosphotransferase n=1 Tax=Reyranella sp. CPCC 100927 TaxID=2599616 RepID=UPI0015B4A479|nr:aminoglycoside phosphotransferase family protein [Reyranella sp. CPCC 100927]